jgi:hypothetical protein
MDESLREEFAGAALGDVRRTRRAQRVVAALQASPAATFPSALRTSAELEGFYRLMSNDEVTFDSLFQAHSSATAGRCAGLETLLVIHDSTDFTFKGDGRHDLGVVNHSGQGFYGHFSIAVSGDGRRDPLGTLAVHRWTRAGAAPASRVRKGEISHAQARKLPRESGRWLAGITAAESALSSAGVSAVHVADSEADDYALLAQLCSTSRRFVIRSFRDRRLLGKCGGHGMLLELVARLEEVSTRSVKLSARKKRMFDDRKRTQARAPRQARLTFSAGPVELLRPTLVEAELPEVLRINVVHVAEPAPPQDQEPVDWLLFTTEPVNTAEQILRVVDMYRARWVIEEFFKALKTGCAFEKRQLESWQTLQNALALFIPIAWSLLRIRTLAREEGPNLSSDVIITSTQLEVLRRATKMPLSNPTVREVLLAIARVGGHIKNNGDPGWIVLGRGYTQLLSLEAGFRLARRRSDQS